MTIRVVHKMIANRRDKENMNQYERQPGGASSEDVLGAWALAVAVLLSLLLLSVA